MSNSIMVCNRNNNYYFKFMNKELILNTETLSFVKDNISYPICFVFNEVPLVIIKEIMKYFEDWNIFIDLKKLEDKKYLASLDQAKGNLFVPVYEIFGPLGLDRVRKRVNPYHYCGWDFRLDEVDRNSLSIDCCRPLYFLGKDLNDIEKESLKHCYRDIIVSDVVRLSKDSDVKKLKKIK